jgi:hypothetical protein
MRMMGKETPFVADVVSLEGTGVGCGRPRS